MRVVWSASNPPTNPELLQNHDLGSALPILVDVDHADGLRHQVRRVYAQIHPNASRNWGIVSARSIFLSRYDLRFLNQASEPLVSLPI